MPPKKIKPRRGRRRQQSVSFKGGRRGQDDVAGGSIAEADVKRTGESGGPGPVQFVLFCPVSEKSLAFCV
eukprot:SAG22_NODE_5648_length_978_cov_1.207053_2_plen_70_part_00